MRLTPLAIQTLSLLLLLSAQLQAANAEELRGPMLNSPGTTALPDKDKADSMAGLAAPGADAVMTQDFLLVNPSTGTQNSAPAQPLTAYIGMTIKLDVDRKEINFEDLKGLVVTVVNDTNRPLIIDADSATAKVGEKVYKCASVTTLQLAVIPEHGMARAVLDLAKVVAPAAATIGVQPTVRDIYNYATKPVERRYGLDQERRVVESSRFGKRILWPHEKTQGVIYFETKDVLNNAKMEIPVTTLFDKKDTGTLVASP